MPIVTVRIDGIGDLKRALNHDRLLAEPMREALDKARDIVTVAAKQRAPVNTGRLQARVSGKTSSAAVPLWAIVRSMAYRRGGGKGGRYGYVLAAGHRKGNQLHYRSGAFAGQSTKEWLGKALDENRARVVALLSDAARKIEAKFGR